MPNFKYNKNTRKPRIKIKNNTSEKEDNDMCLLLKTKVQYVQERKDNN